MIWENSKQFQNCSNISWWSQNILDGFTIVRIFLDEIFRTVQNCLAISRWSQKFPDSFKIVQIFPDGLKTFRMVSPLSWSFWMTLISSRRFQNCPNISRWSQKISDSFQTVWIFPDGFNIFWTVSKLSGYFQIISKQLQQSKQPKYF